MNSKTLDSNRNPITLIDGNIFKSKIYTVRGIKVMLDADLAEIYGYSTKTFNQQVKNNIEKFPNDFRFQLDDSEIDVLSRSKLLTSMQTKGTKGGRAYNPYAFTEQGIYMLMTVLKGHLATRQSIAIIRLFKQMKDFIVENQPILGCNCATLADIAVQTNRNMNDIVEIRQDLQKVMDNFLDPSTYKHFLILDGQKLEADVAYARIYSMAKKSIIIIDDYVGVKTLDLLRCIERNITVTIFSDQKGNGALTDKICGDFFNVRPDVKMSTFPTINKLHDRYIFLDYGLTDEKLFHCGASSKDAGKSVTTIMQIECPQVYHGIIETLKNRIDSRQ